LIHGPDTKNFRASYERLAKAEAAYVVTTAEELAEALNALQKQGSQMEKAHAAREALKQDTDLDALVQSILSHLPET
jgi:3-deoxy-D-manno-octulosonic-acid transferase